MGLFGGKKSSGKDVVPEKAEVGAHYVRATGEGGEAPLPVATPVTAEVVNAPPPLKQAPPPAYAPPPPNASVATQPGGNVVLMKNSTQTPAAVMGLRRRPASLSSCPYCMQPTRTRVRTYPNIFTWLLCLILLLLFWPICWIPLVLDFTKQTDHFCTSCNNKVGTVRSFQDCCEKHRT